MATASSSELQALSEELVRISSSISLERAVEGAAVCKKSEHRPIASGRRPFQLEPRSLGHPAQQRNCLYLSQEL
jgi:hypothetical protein